MDNNVLPVFSVFWLGLLTSISPCPFATNIAATTYISKQIQSKIYLLVTSLFYALGRSFTYTLLCILILFGVSSISILSNILQFYMNKILGPVLIVAGLYMLEFLTFSFKGFQYSYKFQKKIADSGLLGAFILGGLFALTFCPVSAAFFFGSVIPISLKFSSNIILPFIYGIGTAIPVIGAAILINYSTHSTGLIFNKLNEIEIWLRKITAIIFIIIGAYFCLKYIFNIINF